ncbi:MAG: V-type ATPase subunit [Nitrospirae bacterium]|nr:V-type ATPase subunit [Nitrospirota bacterium]
MAYSPAPLAMNGMTDYAYTNARIRAMQGRLFDRAGYESLLAQATLMDALDALKRSPYAATLERTAEKQDATPGAEARFHLDEALRQDLVLSLSKLRRITSDRAHDLLGLLLLRWDVYNLKTVLRGKRAHAPTKEVLASTLPVGWLDEVALAELARAPTLRAVADTLETWRAPLARPLREGLRVLGDADTLQPLEFELDRFTLTKAFRMVADGDDNDQVVKAYLRLLVDKTNLLIALRYLEERNTLSEEPIARGTRCSSGCNGSSARGHEAGRHFLEANGRFTRAHYDAVVGARDARHAMARLADTPIRRLAGTFPEGDAPSLPRIERTLDRALLHAALGLSRGDPLGIGVAVAYIERKVNEVRNLRMILRGKASGMGAEQIREWLII